MNRKTKNKATVLMGATLFIALITGAVYQEKKLNETKSDQITSSITQADDGHYYITTNNTTKHAPECDHESHKKRSESKK